MALVRTRRTRRNITGLSLEIRMASEPTECARA